MSTPAYGVPQGSDLPMTAQMMQEHFAFEPGSHEALALEASGKSNGPVCKYMHLTVPNEDRDASVRDLARDAFPSLLKDLEDVACLSSQGFLIEAFAKSQVATGEGTDAPRNSRHFRRTALRSPSAFTHSPPLT
jgi:hypothetical protein